MENPPDDKELNELSDIYSILKGDAREIVHDLQKGIVMWREAAGANIAAAGFLLILALTSYRSFSMTSGEGLGIVIAQVVLAIVLLGIAGFGLKKYFKLRTRYAPLLEKAKKLE